MFLSYSTSPCVLSCAIAVCVGSEVRRAEPGASSLRARPPTRCHLKLVASQRVTTLPDYHNSSHVQSARLKAMASVTLGQHPGRHHLDSEKMFFPKLADKGKKLMRKSSQEKMTRERAAASAAAPTVPLLMHRPSSDTISGTGLEMCDSSDAQPPRSTPTDGTADADRVPAAQCALERAFNDAAQTRSRTDAPNANTNNNGIVNRNHPRRSSAKNISELSPRSGGKRVKIRSLSADGDGFEGLQLERLTQGRSGVVRLMRNDQRRRQAWSIFDQGEPRMKEEKGEGHLFVSLRVTQDWCDACNRRIKSAALRCECKLIQE